MKKFLFFVVSLIAMTSLMAQSNATTTTSNPAYQSLTVQQFAESIMYDSVLRVDVRTPQEYAAGHLDAAVNVPWGNTFGEALKNAKISKEKTLAVYCRSGRRSKMAANYLAQQGYKVVELNTGIVGWQKEKMPVVTD